MRLAGDITDCQVKLWLSGTLGRPLPVTDCIYFVLYEGTPSIVHSREISCEYNLELKSGEVCILIIQCTLLTLEECRIFSYEDTEVIQIM